MNQVSLNFNKNLNFKSNPVAQQPQYVEQQIPDVQIPDMYYVPDGQYTKKGFKETLKAADMMGLVYPWVEHPILMAGTCAGLAYGVDKFSQACSGEYEKSLVGKAAKLGDKIVESKFVQSDAVQKVVGWSKKGVSKFNEVTKNSGLINAIRYTPSRPEWTIVKDELLNMESRIVHQFTTVAENLKLADERAIKITDIGLDKAEKDLIKQVFNVNSVSKAPQEKAVNYVLLKRLGFDEARINSIINMSEGATQATKKEILNAMGLTVDDIANAYKNPEKYVGKIREAVGKVKGKVRVGAGEYSFLGPIQPFKRTIGCDELYNRFHSLGDGAKSKLGKSFSRFLQKCHRGFTFGGGKLGVLLFVSPLLVETMIDAKKAEPNQKVGTVAHGLVEAVSWVFTFPLAISIMHHLGGAQYAGMSKEAIEEIRNIKETFNNTIFNSHDEYKAALRTAKARVKELETVKNQNLLTKISRKLGKFMTLDLERFKSYRNGSAVGNTVRKIPGFFKNLAGVPMRLGIWGCLSMGVLGAAITKGTKLIFGNYYDRYKVEENDANKKKQKEFLHQDLQNRLLEAQTRKVMAAQGINQMPEINPIITDNNQADLNQAIMEANNPFNKSVEDFQQKPILDENLVEKAETVVKPEAEQVQLIKEDKEQILPMPASIPSNQEISNKPVENKYIPNQNPNAELFRPVEEIEVKRDNYTYIPSSENVLNKKNADEQGDQKYIPSQLGAKFTKSFDNSGLADALRRADRAEQKAIQTLAGNFNGI